MYSCVNRIFGIVLESRVVQKVLEYLELFQSLELFRKFSVGVLLGPLSHGLWAGRITQGLLKAIFSTTGWWVVCLLKTFV